MDARIAGKVVGTAEPMDDGRFFVRVEAPLPFGLMRGGRMDVNGAECVVTALMEFPAGEPGAWALVTPRRTGPG